MNLVPRGFNLTTYKLVMADQMFWTNYRNTVVYTVVATFIAMVLTTCYAYVLSKKHLKGRWLLVGLAVFTMFFTGGLIPNYVLITSLGLKNTIWAIALPNAINVFNLLVMKAFFESLPHELEEAASVDGLNTYGILLRIVLPLSRRSSPRWSCSTLSPSGTRGSAPSSTWIDWTCSRSPCTSGTSSPARVTRRRRREVGSGADVVQSAATIQAVTIVLTILPIVMVYPFVQRYFVTGIMLGAVKG